MLDIPSGPAWAVAVALVFGGIALLLRAALPFVNALKSRNGNAATALERERAMAELKEHMDAIAAESREHRDTLQRNLDATRHSLATPLQNIILTLAEIRTKIMGRSRA